MTDQVGDTPVAANWANVAYLLRATYVGPRAHYRMMLGSARILRQIQRKNRKTGGYFHQTSGVAAEYLRQLQDQRTRTHFLRKSRIAPEKFKSDEHIARFTALAKILYDLEKRLDDEFYKRLPRFIHECHKVDALAKLDTDDADLRADMALDRLEAALNAVVDDAVRYTGRCLERDFGGWRAADVVAKLATIVFGPRRVLDERQVRHLCGWDEGRSTG